ncbi:MAG TPA: tRNA 2-thiouridine(34) synthase MnmA [Candidatus Dojkabacteria bacterium]|nr:tRNA 2-thiouridine(34) synthase MnmA [Candidatus Dojkabacteria bacterium]
MSKKVFVGLSGGVDSATTAYLLKEQGYEVTGVFMKNWSGEDYGVSDQCPWRRDLDDTIAICKHLNIEHKTYNFEKEYRELVIEPFFKDYQSGITPNPDILCNKFIKFDMFLNRALAEGADYIATGHYSKTKDGYLYKAADPNKDQTYFLYQLTDKQLEKVLFPLADIHKPQVREIARKASLPVSEKKDSQGICFVGKVDVEDFIRSVIPDKKGEFRDIVTDKVLGYHNGHWLYTIGQRKGIRIGGGHKPYFVCNKESQKNIVYLAEGKEHNTLWGQSVILKDLHIINHNDIETYKHNSSSTKILNEIGQKQSGQEVNEKLDHIANLTGTVRYRTKDTPCTLYYDKISSRYQVIFDQKQWAPAPGQSCVLFDGQKCIGGGQIISVML